MGSKGDAYDNAVAETFFATLKKELVNRRSWPSRLELDGPASSVRLTRGWRARGGRYTLRVGICPIPPVNREQGGASLSLKMFYKSATVGAYILLVTSAFTPAALAISAISLPNSDITGKPAHWSPSKLTAKARWDGVQNDCGQSQGSFTIQNKESVAEKVTLTGTNGFKSLNQHGPTNPLSPGGFSGVCVKKGYHGTVTAKLSDGKKLTVTF